MIILKSDPLLRANDKFIYTDQINGTPYAHDVGHRLIKNSQTVSAGQVQLDFYQHAALDIVTETVFDYPYPFISEKTFRPIACKRMFIIVGPCGVLSTLRSRGFQTFNDFFDESYDIILDPEKRFLAAMSTIREVCSRPLSDLKEYINQNQSKIEHNFSNLLLLRNREVETLKKQLDLL
jgi:hypothetical protein